MLFLPWPGKAGFGRRSVSRSWLVLFIYGALYIRSSGVIEPDVPGRDAGCLAREVSPRKSPHREAGQSFDRCCGEMAMPDAGNRVIHFESIGLADHSQPHFAISDSVRRRRRNNFYHANSRSFTIRPARLNRRSRGIQERDSISQCRSAAKSMFSKPERLPRFIKGFLEMKNIFRNGLAI
jgi:hypothetical protein